MCCRLWDLRWGGIELIRIDINLSSRPFVNYRKFYLIAGSLLSLFLIVSLWNLSQYRTSHERIKAFVQWTKAPASGFAMNGEPRAFGRIRVSGGIRSRERPDRDVGAGPQAQHGMRSAAGGAKKVNLRPTVYFSCTRQC